MSPLPATARSRRRPAEAGRCRPPPHSVIGDDGNGATTRPLLTTVTPPADTTNPRARSCSLSTPTVAPSKTATFLSRMAFSTTAWRWTRELRKITARSTRDQLSTRAPGDRTELRTSPPDTITPLLTTLLIARPTRSPSSWTNFAGGWEDTRVEIGQRSLYRLNTGFTAHRSMCALK